ncbi:kinase-like protein [Melanomma pulvis-pyrius CBS 109.77]|uniref:Kinase-like protein n=1 Tax=Melanomma pulvis-pyrius CBS 109.77 TaxID=1314802 RepID=A0A6A6WZ78_9PLEO|nr:kinase-like protein [Melanomma pulvis-pyrius CBS 109.77]
MVFTSPEESNTWTQDPENPHHSFRYIQDYTPPGVIERIGAGNSSAVGLLGDGTVLKYPLVKGEDMESLTVEKAIYDALGHHERIIRCLGITDHGLKLEFASQGSVTHYLAKNPASSTELRLRWCRQAAEALAFLHSKGIIHCDLHTNNLLLDAKLNALLSDFQGTYKHLDGYAMESARYFLPREATSPPNQVTDMFALGTLMYTIMVGIEPYPGLLEAEVEERYRRHEFPSTDDIVCGKMILQCWNRECTSAKEVVHSLVSLEQH